MSQKCPGVAHMVIPFFNTRNECNGLHSDCPLHCGFLVVFSFIAIFSILLPMNLCAKVHIALFEGRWQKSFLLFQIMLGLQHANNASYCGSSFLCCWLTQQSNALLWGHAWVFGSETSPWLEPHFIRHKPWGMRNMCETLVKSLP